MSHDGQPAAPPDVSVLVCSCDRYADLWRPFFAIFHLRWPDCPWPVYLGSNHRRFDGDRVETIAIGDDKAWGENLLAMLARINTPRVLLMLEDFLIYKPVETARVAALAQIAKEHNLACLRLAPMPAPSRRLPDHPQLGEIRPGDEYRVSTQAALWDVAVLRRLLKPEFSAWQFEHVGSITGEQVSPNGFWGSYEPAIHYTHGVERGLWLPRGLEICRQAGVEADLSARPAMNWRRLAASRAWAFAYAVFRHALPRSVQQRLRRRNAAQMWI